MRTAILAALVLALLALPSGLPSHVGASHAAAAPTATVLRLPSGAPSPPSLGAALNVTLAPSLQAALPSAAPPPTSALPITPPITPPATTPSVMWFLNSSKTCCVSANFTAPVGRWSLVELKYNGQAVAGVYDSTFRAYIDQVQVLFGSTPEYGQWNVSTDVTRYVSLLSGTFNFTFLLSAAVTSGYFLTTVSLWFYPTPAGDSPPAEPTTIVPLFHRVFSSPATPTLYSTATVPTNATNATLEMWTYALDADEFWYTLKPTYRELFLAVDGQGLAAIAPFVFINTGGTDPFAWRPITGAYTLSDPSYSVDVSGALGLLEGTHNFSANVSGVGTGANWLVGAALLLWTDPTAGPATQTSYRFSAPLPSTSSSGSLYSQSEHASYAYRSSFTLGSDPVAASTFGNTSFSSQLSSPIGWTNVTVSNSWDQHALWAAPNLTVDTSSRTSLSGSMDLGGTFLETGNTGGGYPIYGNFSTLFLNARQDWNATVRTTTTIGAGPASMVSRSVDNLIVGGNNLYAGTEELTSPTAALILSVTLIESATLDSFRASSSGGAVPYLYAHLVAGSAYQPAGPNNAETVIANRIDAPLFAALTVDPSVVDLGSPVTIRAQVAGGIGPVTVSYLGLPAGCASSNLTALECRPASAGAYPIAVSVSDGSGQVAAIASTMLEVHDLPSVIVQPSLSEAEVNLPASVTASVSGGTAPFSCAWTVDGTSVGTLPCGTAIPLSPSSPGTENLSVQVTDALGAQANSSYQLRVAAGPLVGLWFRDGTSAAPADGDRWVVQANVTGGVAPFVITFYVSGGGAFVVMQNSSNRTWVSEPVPQGNYTISVGVTDALGGTATSAPLSVVVGPALTGAGGGSGASSPASSNDLYLGLALGVALGIALGAVIGVVVVRRRR